MKTALFLCTGNYYRGRFAEEVFNFHAREKSLNWCCESAGMRVPETIAQNPGTVSPLVSKALETINIVPVRLEREPRQVSEDLLNFADLIIATSMSEHKPMIEESIPRYLNKITFWDVQDILIEHPTVALKNLLECTLKLLDRLEAAG